MTLMEPVTEETMFRHEDDCEMWEPQLIVRGEDDDLDS